MKSIKSMSLIFFILILSACSKTPSAGDIEDALAELYADCKPVEISNVKKENGMELENGRYKVTYSFDIRVKALDENKEIMKKTMSVKDEVIGLWNDMNTAYYAMEKEKQELSAEYRKRAEVILQSPDSSDEYKKLREEINQRHQAFETKFSDYQDEIFKQTRSITQKVWGEPYADYNSLVSVSSARQMSNFDRKCHVKNKRAIDILFLKTMKTGSISAVEKLEMFGKGIESGFNSEHIMVKTENGWRFDF